MLCVFELATCLCNRLFFVCVGMTKSFGKRPRIRGFFFVGWLCLEIIVLFVFKLATCLCNRPFLVCVGMRRTFGKRPRI